MFLLFSCCCGFSLSAQTRYADSVITFSTQYSPVSWSAKKILGAPDSYPRYGDISTAWAPRNMDGQREYIELYFANPAPVQSIAVYETYNPGTIDTLYVKNPATGKWVVVWSGTAGPMALPAARVFIKTFPRTTFNVSQVRIAINSPAVPGWNEFDAVSISSTAESLNLPDISVTTVQVPAEAWTDQTIDVSWQVKNFGTKGTGAVTWTDAIYLTPNPELDVNSVALHVDLDNASALDAGQSYAAKKTITIPRGLSGNYYLFVYTDMHHQLTEADATNNVSRTTEPILLHLSPEPDLMTTSLIAPTIAFAGDTIRVSSVVKNIGKVATPAGIEWSDQFFFSQDTLLVVGEAEHLNSIVRKEVLQPDSSYRITASIAVPRTLTGTYYLYLFADKWDDVYENRIESNNIRRSPAMEIVNVAPALQVTAVTAPLRGNSGQKMQVEWTVHNAGAGATYEHSWADRVYYSTAPVFDPYDVSELGTFTHDGTLAVDGSYHVVSSVVLPNGIEGQYYIYVQADHANDVFERSTPAERVLRSAQPVTISLSPWPDLRVTSIVVPKTGSAGREIAVSWTVENKGIAAAPAVIWNDQVFMSPDSSFDGSAVRLGDFDHSGPLAPGGRYTRSATVVIPPTIAGTVYVHVWSDGDNVVYEHIDESTKRGRSTAVLVAPYPPIDLSATELVVPDTVGGGETVNVRWTVKNIGAGRTLGSDWNDGLYISKYVPFDPDSSRLLRWFGHEGALDPGASYSRTMEAEVPEGIVGSYYWFIVSDGASYSGDSTLGNNIRSTPKPVIMPLVQRPDLTVTTVWMDDSVYAGQPAMVRWTVRNASAGPVRAGAWYDGVYLSANNVLDKNALKLETRNHDGTLAPLASYTDSIEVTIPLSLAGANYVIVRADDRKDIAETREDNNVGSAGSMLRLAAPSDLLVSSIVAPDSAEPGDMVTVTYTLRNQGVNPAKGYLTDAVYVSSDLSWEAADPLIGTVENYIEIPPGDTQVKTVRVRCAAIAADEYTGTAEGELPGITPGLYHIIVRTDIRDNIVESSNVNNTFASPSLMRVRVPSLQRNVAQQTVLTQDQSKYFSFTAVEGEDILVTLDGGTQDGFNEMFVRFGDLPSRGQYEYLYQNQNSVSQQVTVSSTKAGTYYILIRGESVYHGSSACTISAKTLQFHIDSVQAPVAGIGGEITVKIIGAKFRPGALAQLRRAGMPTVNDTISMLVSSTQLNARFATTGMAEGMYDVAVVNTDGGEAVLPNAILLQPGNPSQLFLAFAGPTRLRVNSIAPLNIVAYNPTNMNIQRALIHFKVRKEMNFWTETDQSLFTTTPHAWTADSLVDEDGNRVFSVYLYNLPPKQTKMIRLLVEPTVPGRYVFMADAYVLDRKKFDSLLVVALREAVNQGWFPSLAGGVPGVLSKQHHLAKVADDCAGDEAGVCEYLNHRQRDIDMANDAQAVVIAGAEASTVTSPKPGSLMKLAKFFKSLMDFFNKYKGSSGYAADGVSSLDPNDLVGPSGYGDEHWVSVSQTLQYTIHFENDPAQASAPAQTVTISMDLDSTVDANSFRHASFGFAGMTFNDAAGRGYYSQRLDCRDSVGVFVDVAGGVDVVQNKVFWKFTSVDPATGNLPADPMVGMLPVNDALHHGEGSVSYTIKPKAAAKTRDLIVPKAKIVFDANAPIDTPPLFNTIDAGVPVSAVQALPAQTGTDPITVVWSGRDDTAGSGVKSYSVYVSKNDSAFTPWLTNVRDTSSQFTGVWGNRYRFFSLAADNAGNMESIKMKPEANVFVTGIGTGENAVPASYSLEQNFPNPFNPSTTIRYGLKEHSTVRIDIYNVLGQVVTQLHLGRKNAGIHHLTVDMSRYSSGIYFYRIDAAGAAGGRFISIRKMLMVK